jgi:hypothetical protein
MKAQNPAVATPTVRGSKDFCHNDICHEDMRHYARGAPRKHAPVACGSES